MKSRDLGFKGLHPFKKGATLTRNSKKGLSLFKGFHQLRFKTTFHLHLKASKINWYKKWHDYKFSHHIHVATAVFAFGIMAFSAILNLVPSREMLLAANGNWSQTTFAGSGDGTYTNTSSANANGDVGLSETKLSNDGGGDWNYRKKINVNNTTATPLTDYQVSVDSEKDLVGHWNFDETSGTAYDSSWNGNNGTLVGNTNQNVAGRYNKGAYFDGSGDYITTVHNNSFSFGSQITISGWVKGSFSDYRWIVGKYSNPGGWMMYMNNGKLYLDGRDGLLYRQVISDKLINDNQWHFITGTINNNIWRIYIDGVFEKQTDTGYMSTNIDNTVNFTIGSYAGSNNYWLGYLDEIKLNKKALSDTEIWQEYQQQNQLIFNNIKSDGLDIRFTDSDGKTELPYWIESFNNSLTGKKSYKVWVKTSVGASTNKDIYMYYGNSSATSSGNGTNTFPTFFDDFNDGSLDTTNRWTVTGGAPTESGGFLNLKRSTLDNIKSKTTFSMPLIAETSIKKLNIASGTYEGSSFNVKTSSGANDTLYLGGYYNGRCSSPMPRLEVYDEGVWGGSALCFTGKTVTDSALHSYRMDITAASQSGYYDGHKNTWNKNFNTGQTYMLNYSVYDNVYGADLYVDWSFVRQYASIEPTITEYGGLARMPYKKDITLNTSATGANISTAQYDFPMAVHVNSSSMPNATERSHFFGDWNTSGKRAQFWESDESIALDYEVEYYDQATQEAIYWVRVPKVDGNSTTDKIKLAYGNDTGANQDNGTGVWINGYVMVQHLEESSGVATDSIGSNNSTNSSNWTYLASGSVGKAFSYNGTSNYTTLGTSSSLRQNQSISYSYWAYMPSGGGGYTMGAGSSGGHGYGGLVMDLSNLSFSWTPTTPVSDTHIQASSLGFVANQWNHIFITVDFLNKTRTLYINGQSKTTSMTQNPTNWTPSASYSSGRVDAFGGRYVNSWLFFNGRLDEINVFSTIPPADWVKLSYYSTKKTTFNGDSWVSYGAESAANYVSMGYKTSGTFASAVIPSISAHLGKIYGWGNFSFTNNLNSQTITYDVLDSATGNPITGYTGISASPADLSGINPLVYPSLKVRANLSGDGAVTPYLNDITLAYSYDITAPTVPTALTIGTVTADSVPLSWTASTDADSSDGQDGRPIPTYEVQRAPDSSGSPGTWVSAAGTCAGVVTEVSCTDSSLAANTKYYYRVRAKDAVGNTSGWSGEHSADANTVGLWHMNETSGITATDSSGNSNTGYMRDIQVDAMDSTTGWTGASGTTVSLNTTTKHEGTGAINYIKSSSGVSESYAQKNITATNMTNRYLNTWMYIKDEATLSKLPSAQIFIFAPDVSNLKYKTFTGLAVGWNLLTMDISDGTGQVGNPNFSNVQLIRADANTSSGTDIFVAGDVIVDDWFMSEKKQVAGKFDNALSFDGVNDKVLTSSVPSAAVTELTVEAWVYIDQYNTASAVSTPIVSDWNIWNGTNQKGYSLKTYSTGGNLKWVFSVCDDDSTYHDVNLDILPIADFITKYPEDNWYHIVGVFKGGTYQRLYVNGVLGSQAGTSATQMVPETAAPTYLGYTGIGSGYLNGKIDEVRISNVARTSEQILASYTDGSLSAYTLPPKPTLNTPTLYTQDVTPVITNSSNPDISFANSTVKLKDDGTVVAETTADGSGVFSFSDGDYSQNLTDGLHDNLTVVVLNGDNQESVPSDAVSIHVDTDAPQGPSVATAKEGSEIGADLLDNDWNQHNNGPTVYFEWTGANDLPFPPNSSIKRHWVYFGSDANAIPRTDGEVTTDAQPNATKTLSSPQTGTDYYLRVQSEDEAGNISDDGEVTTLFTYKFDDVAPTPVPSISVTPPGWTSDDPFTFTWSDGADAESGLYGYEYKRNNGTDNWTRIANANPDTVDIDHYQTGVNYFLLATVDMAGNQSTSVNWPYLFSGNVGAPQNLSVDLSQSQGQTINNFKFTWDPPAVGNTVGYYYSINSVPSSENSIYTEDPYTDFGPFAKSNGVNQTFYVVAKDDFGNVGWNNFNQTSFIVNTVAPGVPLDISITDTSNRNTNQYALTLMWVVPETVTTDFSHYVIERSTDGINFVERATIEKSNTGYLDTGLSNATEYFYRVKSKDNVGNTSDPTAIVHKIPTGKYTVPPTFTSDPSSDAKAMSVKISWTTNRASNTVVQYGTTTSYGQEASKSTEAVTDHSIEILGLTPGVTYHYRVQSLDAERDYDPNSAFSSDFTFSTQAAPGISNVEVSEIRLTSAILTWKTTSSATSKILYGTSTTYGKQYVDNSGSSVTTHTVKINDLSDSTTYNFKIQGTDVDGNNLLSDNYVFTTLTFPRLSNYKVEQVKNTATSTVKVKFSSNVPTTANVNVSGNGGKESAQYNLKTSHEMTISGLKDNTSYNIIASARDQYGNEADSISETYKTEFDTRPPQISGITTETSIIGYGIDAKGQVIISWVTDEPASSQIEYGAGATGGEYSAKTQEDMSLSENHVIIISDLKASSPYHFRVISHDNAGNKAQSQDNSVLTDQATESIIDIIIKSLQASIGWIFNVFSRNN